MNWLIQNDIFYETDCAIAYPVVGCFTEYLILTYGMEKYLKLYRSSDGSAAAIEKVYHKTVHDLNADFPDYIHLFTLNPMVKKRMDALRQE